MVGAQMTAIGTVRVHVRHQIELCLGQQRGDLGILRILQTLDQPFHEPLGHVLPRMLLGDDPQFARSARLATDAQ